MKHTKLLILAVISLLSTAIIAKRPERPQKEFFSQDLKKHLVTKRGMQKKGPSEVVSRTGFVTKDKAPKRKNRRKK